jgi:hypothetical protein
VFEQLAGDLELMLLLGELGQLAVYDLVTRSLLASGHQGADLGEREPDLAKEADEADFRYGRVGLAAPPAGLAFRGSHQAELVVVAQRGGGHTCALGEFPDR